MNDPDRGTAPTAARSPAATSSATRACPTSPGRYLYGDLCTGSRPLARVERAEPGRDRPGRAGAERPALPTLISFGEDACGRVYVVTEPAPSTESSASGRAAACPPTPAPHGLEARRRTVVAIRAWHGSRDRSIVRINARVRPCAENRHRRLILKRDGRMVASRRVRGRCVVGFQVQVEDRAVFRALLPAHRGAGAARSRRVVVRGPQDR